MGLVLKSALSPSESGIIETRLVVGDGIVKLTGLGGMGSPEPVPLRGLAPPSEPSDAADKAYVDEAIAASAGGGSDAGSAAAVELSGTIALNGAYAIANSAYSASAFAGNRLMLLAVHIAAGTVDPAVNLNATLSQGLPSDADYISYTASKAINPSGLAGGGIPDLIVPLGVARPSGRSFQLPQGRRI
jgi:hypothetical protein